MLHAVGRAILHMTYDIRQIMWFIIWHIIYVTCHVVMQPRTHDIWHMTHDTWLYCIWHMTCYIVEVLYGVHHETWWGDSLRCIKVWYDDVTWWWMLYDMRYVICDVCYVTCDMSYVTCDMWHVTYDSITHTWRTAYDPRYKPFAIWHMPYDTWCIWGNC